MTEPCPCFLCDDDGENTDTCECGHPLLEHIDEGQGPKECADGHHEDCPLDHGSEPCPVTR